MPAVEVLPPLAGADDGVVGAEPGVEDLSYRLELPLVPEGGAVAVLTFLLKILLPGFAVRDRPERSSSRKSKKADDFPGRQPEEPPVINVKRRIRFHLIEPWMII